MGAPASLSVQTGRALAAGALLALGAGRVAAPLGPDAGPDAHELANLDPRNIVPKSSPLQISAVFAKTCIDGPAEFTAAGMRLRAAGFVPPTPAKETGLVAFVSDDKRPMVLISRGGRSCAVAAAARTGQTARLHALVADRFPEARPLDVAALGQPWLEAAWQVEEGIISLQRITSPLSYSRLIFGIWRTT